MHKASGWILVVATDMQERKSKPFETELDSIRSKWAVISVADKCLINFDVKVNR